MNNSSSAAVSAKSIFFFALEFADAEERARFITEACKGDHTLQVAVERLFDVNPDATGNLLDRTAKDLHPSLDFTSEPAETASLAQAIADGTQRPIIGRYKLLEEIGRGGMGTVYMAQQLEPVKRKVALKVINPGMDSREVIARFEAERQALAMMDHPNIARVFDGGTTEQERPYFVMEMVRGIPITEYCDKHDLSLDDRLRLFIEVCQAVQHAHQKGIIHRDLKPSNVQVTHDDGNPVVKVIDFGVAKALNHDLTDRTLFTQFSQLVGTPLYMSPEQADRHGYDGDTRSDVYSLGVLLYELLTGTTPFDRDELSNAGVDGARKMICEIDPPRPSLRVSTLKAADDSTLNIKREQTAKRNKRCFALRGDLDWIVMKALERHRNDRYESASSLGLDVQRYLDNEPIEAKPPTALTRLSKWSRRHVGVVWTGLAAAALLAMISAIGAGVLAQSRNDAIQGRRVAEEASQIAENQKLLAERQRDLTLENLYVASVSVAHQDWKDGNLIRMSSTLDALTPRDEMSDVRGWEWYYLASLLQNDTNRFNPNLGAVYQVQWSPDGKSLAVSGQKGIKILEPASRQPVFSTSDWADFHWSPDGSKLAAMDKGTPSRIVIWDRESQEVARSTAAGSRWIAVLRWSPDGTKLAWTYGHTLHVWHVDEDQSRRYEYGGNEHGRGFRSLAWQPDGQGLIVGNAYPALLVMWDGVKEQFGDELRELGGAIEDLSWSPHNGKMAVATAGSIAVWDMESAMRLTKFSGHRGITNSVDWRPDGNQLVSAGEDHLIRVWNARTTPPTRLLGVKYQGLWQQLNCLAGHAGKVTSVDWSPDGNRIASGCEDGTVGIWNPEDRLEALKMPGFGAMAWDPTGELMVMSCHRPTSEHEAGPKRKNNLYKIINSRTGQEVLTLETRRHRGLVYAWSTDGRLIAAVNEAGSIGVWDAKSGRLVHLIENAHSSPTFERGQCRGLALSPDAMQCASCGTDRLIKIWELASGRLLRTLKGHEAALGSVLWSPDGRWLASEDWHNNVKIWDAASWKLLWEIDPSEFHSRSDAVGDYVVAWSPDSRRLACRVYGDLVVWKVQEDQRPEMAWSTKAHTAGIRCVAWNRLGNRIATLSRDRLVKIWHADTGRELLTFDVGGADGLAWSPDGQRLASGDRGVGVLIWDASRAYTE